MDKLNVYLISGLGADERAFERIKFTEPEINNRFNFIPISWVKPELNESIQSYSRKLASQINTSQKFILVGLSFGGLISIEIDAIFKAEKIFLISSIKSARDKSTLLKILKFIPLHSTKLGKTIIQSPWFISFGLRIGRKKTAFKKGFFEMLNSLPNGLIFWGIKKIVDWDYNLINTRIVQIHGEKDLIFKIKNPDYLIKKGTHLLIYTKAHQVKKILLNELMNIR